MLKIKELTGGLKITNENTMYCTALIIPGQLLSYRKGFKRIQKHVIKIATAKHCIYDDEGKLIESDIYFILASNQNSEFKVLKYKDLTMKKFEDLKPKINIEEIYDDYAELLVQITNAKNINMLSLLNKNMITKENKIISLNKYISQKDKKEKEEPNQDTYAYFNYGLVVTDKTNLFILTSEVFTDDESGFFLAEIKSEGDNSNERSKLLKHKIFPSIRGRSGGSMVKCQITKNEINCKVNSVIHALYVYPKEEKEDFDFAVAVSKNKNQQVIYNWWIKRFYDKHFNKNKH